jgi:hypothetical protein
MQMVVSVPAGVVVVGDDLLVVGIGDPVVVSPHTYLAGEGGVQFCWRVRVWRRPSAMGCSDSQTA